MQVLMLWHNMTERFGHVPCFLFFSLISYKCRIVPIFHLSLSLLKISAKTQRHFCAFTLFKLVDVNEGLERTFAWVSGGEYFRHHAEWKQRKQLIYRFKTDWSRVVLT